MDSSVDQYAVLTLLFLAVIPKASAVSIPWDANCGSTMGCFPNCPDGCDYLVTWQTVGGSLAFTMKAVESDTNKYLAIGFSSDRRMGDDSVVGCIPAGTSMKSYYNEGTETEELTNSATGLSSITVAQSGGVISCTFTRAFTDSDPNFFDLNNDYWIQLVLGEVENEGGSYKLEEHHMIPWFSDGEVDFNSNIIVDAYKLNNGLVKLHGIMMVLAWLLFSLVGIATARYNKDMMPETKLFGTKVWFQLHRGLMIAVVVCIVIAFIPIFVECQGYSQIPPAEGEGFTVSHPVLGIVITVLAFLNPIGALLRPGPDHKFRWMFNWGHFALGIITQFLAILTIFFGYVLDRSVMDDAPLIVTGVQLICIAVFAVALELHKWFGGKKTGSADVSTADNLGMEEKNGGPAAKPTASGGSQKSKLPFIALIVFSVLMLIFALVILGLIASG